jgi:predicted NAD/FAD-binding protein
MTHVAVVGGGYAGMAAAATLAGRGIPVTVFEAARQLGGRARRIDYREVALDNGLHILIGAYTETLRLIALVNPAHADALLRLPLEWHVQGEFHLRAARLPAPLHLLTGLLRADGLSIAEKFSAARFLAALRASRYTLPQDISVELLLKQHDQSEKLRRVLWRPLYCATASMPPVQPAISCLREPISRRCFPSRRQLTLNSMAARCCARNE